jgi:prepilin-type processing-associated H-X9-DG protein
MPLPGMNCPSRRDSLPLPLITSNQQFFQCAQITAAVRGDYAINSGDPNTGDPEVPAVNQPTTLPPPSGFVWADTSIFRGVCFQRSQVTVADISDGLSNTYFVGEKYLGPDWYFSGTPDAPGVTCGDMLTIYAGPVADQYRITTLGYPPMQDQPGVDSWQAFGSPHPGGFNISFCDGSVQTISYSIDPEIHRRLGNRKDNLPIDGGKL